MVRTVRTFSIVPEALFHAHKLIDGLTSTILTELHQPPLLTQIEFDRFAGGSDYLFEEQSATVQLSLRVEYAPCHQISLHNLKLAYLPQLLSALIRSYRVADSIPIFGCMST